MLPHTILALFYLVLSYSALAQSEKCGTVLFNHKQGKDEESKVAFEQWMSQKLKERGDSPFKRVEEAVYTIPVVVHIIHRGEQEGVGTNIPYEQVLDQIRILNEDYRRQNPDTINTPGIFQPVAADTRIEFVLAQQDPNGFPTNGIVRVRGNRESYGLSAASTLSELSFWPSEFYLNIWVAPLSPGLLGYASFPVSDVLEGLEDAVDNPATDGVVINYQYFGSIGNASSQSLGRTTTHEIGHFLGLRHIWGDPVGQDPCEEDDYVEDTPLQATETTGCPDEKTSCGNINMIQNYMDYTDDACMNIFTEDQKTRMRIVLENSKRRTSLLTSPALEPPVLADNDAGISRIVSPAPSECDGNITPEISVFNAGQNQLESFRVSLFLQGNLIEEKTSNTDLATGESTTITFSNLNLGQNLDVLSVYELSFFITQANEVEDENPNNNERSVEFVIPQTGELPVFENFENAQSSFLEQIIIRNPDNSITWELTEAPGFGQDNQALVLNFYDYEALGERDGLFTPTYDFSNLESAILSFRYAYAPYVDEENEMSSDGLRVGVSLDCGATIDTLLFDYAGEELATSSAIDEAFIPESRAEWRSVEIPLHQLVGQPNVQLAFIGFNDYGNNLYLDDIQIQAETLLDEDLAITQIQRPALLSCHTEPVPLITIKNKGREPIQSFELTYQVDEQPITSFVYHDAPLAPGEEKEVSLEPLNVSLGLHSLNISLTLPKLQPDEQMEDNHRLLNFYVDDNRDVIPLIQDFNEGTIPDVLTGETPLDDQSWLTINPDSSITWEVADAPGNGRINSAAVIRNFVYEEIGSIDQLVSPTLDFSNTTEASVFFKVSYALFSRNYVDTLRIKVSTDCGNTYTTVYEQSGQDLSITETEAEWVPIQSGDWKQQFIDLSDFAGEPEVRVAFEAVNGYGNNLYLDDIEFFLSNNLDPIALEENTYRVYPNPSDGLIRASFNLLDREDVQLILYSIQGETLWQQVLPFTLNQTYELDLSSQPAGVYILRVNSPSINTSQRFIIY